MNRDIVSIIVRLLKRYWMQKIIKEYRKDYSYHNIAQTGASVINTKYNFMFNYRCLDSSGIHYYKNIFNIYNSWKPLPKNYFYTKL